MGHSVRRPDLFRARDFLAGHYNEQLSLSDAAGVECVMEDNSNNWFSMTQPEGMPPK